MKKIFTFCLLLISSYNLYASHGMGGEITWTCQGGAYVFELKFYRDCNGISGPASVTLETNQPTFASTGIELNLFSQTDISPTGSPTSGTTPCHTCATATGNTLGTVEEFVYHSAPVTLAGIPPATGWAFWYDDCCRSTLLTNINNGSGTVGYTLRAKMYAFNGSTPGQCTDASPAFAEKPSVITCTGYAFAYNHFATDAEGDSLSYAWADPLNDGGYPQSAAPFAPGYSTTSPLPGPAQDPNNVAATLDVHTGQFEFTSFTQGNFVTVVKVSAYKCGQLAAEIYREVNIALIGGCTINGYPGMQNSPPVMIPPFPDSLGNPNSSYDVSVYAGDTLNFLFATLDTDPDIAVGAQYLTLNATGTEFGAGFTNSTTGCTIPPCATLDTILPCTDFFGVQTEFNWNTTTAHLGLNFGCVYMGNKYYFLVKANDNYCPANAMTYRTITVTVLPHTPAPLVNASGGQLTCSLSGNYTYQWFLNGFAIAGATSQSYVPLSNGNYQVLAVDNATGDGNYSNRMQVTTVGIDALDASISNFIVFPNPSANGMYTLAFDKLKAGAVELSVKDAVGKTVVEQTLTDVTSHYETTLNLSAFSKGVYTLQLKTANGNIIQKLLRL